MLKYTSAELSDALRAVNSIIQKCEKAQQKFEDGSSHNTLLRNRLNAMYISKAFISEALKKADKSIDTTLDNAELLIKNIELLHTTELGAERIKRNLGLNVDAVSWCKEKILSPVSCITKSGKNWYIRADSCVITVNAFSYTIITVHPVAENISR